MGVVIQQCWQIIAKALQRTAAHTVQSASARGTKRTQFKMDISAFATSKSVAIDSCHARRQDGVSKPFRKPAGENDNILARRDACACWRNQCRAVANQGPYLHHLGMSPRHPGLKPCDGL